jgi:solute carrier family 24 (sodium/potassium/calcium exchanger), member 6
MVIVLNRKAPPKFFFVFPFLAFILSIVWIFILAQELLQLLSAFGTLWNIPESVLAITVLTWGNSIGDMVSDIVVARSGFPSMAVGAIYGGK